VILAEQATAPAYPPAAVAAAGRLADRLDLELVTDRIVGAVCAEVPAYGDLPAETIGGPVRIAARWNLELTIAWLRSGVMPGPEQLEAILAFARRRAVAGISLGDTMRGYNAGVRVGWSCLLEVTGEAEREHLLAVTPTLIQYLETISSLVGEAYADEQSQLASADERHARRLLGLLLAGDGAADEEIDGLAHRRHLRIHERYVPFTPMIASDSWRELATIAQRLRRRGALAITEEHAVKGLAPEALRLDLPHLETAGDALLAIGDAWARDAVAEPYRDACLLAGIARRTGTWTALRSADHIPELLLARSPHLSAGIRAHVLGCLERSEHAGLLRTLEELLAADRDRTATAQRLFIHRNTLAYRLRRITELTGIDVDCTRDVFGAWLALAGRRAVPGGA
jgi:hypothetical protein